MQVGIRYLLACHLKGSLDQGVVVSVVVKGLVIKGLHDFTQVSRVFLLNRIE
jgi:hypothetical protein